MSKFYDALVNTDDGRKACIKNLNEQGITTPEDATIHQVASNIQLGINGIDMWNTSYKLTSGYDVKKAIKIIPLLDTSQVTYASYMFQEYTSLETIPLLDTSNVTDMSYMFHSCSSLTAIPQLNTSKVTNMSNMFYNCSSLITIPLLDTSNVADMSYMFNYCNSLKTIPQLDTSNVTGMDYMFDSCSKLKEIDISLAPILPSCSMNNTFSSIPKDCLINVYDEASKQKVLESRSDLTNVVVTGGK